MSEVVAWLLINLCFASHRWTNFIRYPKMLLCVWWVLHFQQTIVTALLLVLNSVTSDWRVYEVMTNAVLQKLQISWLVDLDIAIINFYRVFLTHPNIKIKTNASCPDKRDGLSNSHGDLGLTLKVLILSCSLSRSSSKVSTLVCSFSVSFFCTALALQRKQSTNIAVL